MAAQTTHAKRRQRFLEAMERDGIAILPAAPERPRNGDVSYPFRQDSDFLYLTGFPEPEAICVLSAQSETPYTLFVRPRDPERETWEGRRAGEAGAREVFGADAAHPIDSFEEKLPELLKGHDHVYYRLGHHPKLDALLQRTLETLRARNRDGVKVPAAIVDPGAVLWEMRLRKEPEEVEILRRVCALSAEAHVVAMAFARPGLNERDVQAAVEYVFRRRGAEAVGYPSIVASGANATMLHYVQNDAPLEDGDLLLIDAGAELEGYSADITRTFPVGGQFTGPQRDIYQIVLEAQGKAIEAVRPGAPFLAPHEVTVRTLTQGLVDLGLLEGEVDALIEDEKYKRYFMHKTGHWLGLDVHDVGAYFLDGGESRPFEPGMVTTIEPGLYVAPDDEEADARFRGIGVRIEDDVLVTEGGREVLTGGVPKTIEEVEAACQREASLPL